VNNSFYRLPKAATVDHWRTQAPARFLYAVILYAVKASRFLTHMKKLKNPEDPLFRFFDNVKHLGTDARPGPLPAAAPMAGESRTSRGVSPRARPRVGPRDRHYGGWAPRDRVPRAELVRRPRVRLLEQHGVALCRHDKQGSESGRLLVGPFIYVRFHFGDSMYGGTYDDARLDEWGRWLADRIDAGFDVFAYFNNDVNGHAPRDAVRLRDRVQQRRAPSSPLRVKK
jgi:uncharacterized protein YecE (DUF72 family)